MGGGEERGERGVILSDNTGGRRERERKECWRRGDRSDGMESGDRRNAEDEEGRRGEMWKGEE